MKLEELRNKEYEKLTWELEKRNLYKKKFTTILRIYSLVGIITAIFGIIYFLFSIFGINLSVQQRMALMISGVGLTLAIMSRALLIFKKEKETNDMQQIKKMQTLYDFLTLWSKFETVSKALLQKEGEKFNKYSIREIMELLYKEDKIDKSDLFALEGAIQLRNSVVHEGEPFYSDKIIKVNDVLVEIINKVLKVS